MELAPSDEDVTGEAESLNVICAKLNGPVPLTSPGLIKLAVVPPGLTNWMPKVAGSTPTTPFRVTVSLLTVRLETPARGEDTVVPAAARPKAGAANMGGESAGAAFTVTVSGMELTWLAGLFAAASRPVGANMDSFFDPEGEALLAMMLLAAHRGTRPITAVYHWLTDPREDEPVGLLEAARHDLAAAGVRGVIESPDRQRAGVYATAKKMVGFLVDERLSRWCVDDDSDRPQFSARAFATSRDTVYALSREGPGSAGPLTAAFTAGVMRAAEDVASASVRGRLAVPLMAVLDEVANVCRWRELPDLYSHYGSRGITVESYLQSWSQGVECWGREGMAKLWSAANIRVYGGGANEEQFLEAVSKMCGESDVVSESVSDSRLGHTHSQSLRRERVLDVATLAAVPVGRAVVMLSGAPPVVVRTTSCLDADMGEQLRARAAGSPVAEQREA